MNNCILNTILYFSFIIHSSGFIINNRYNRFHHNIIILNNQFFDDEPWPSNNIPSDTNPDSTDSLYNKPSKESPLRDFHGNERVKSYLAKQVKQSKKSSKDKKE